MDWGLKQQTCISHHLEAAKSRTRVPAGSVPGQGPSSRLADGAFSLGSHLKGAESRLSGVSSYKDTSSTKDPILIKLPHLR